MFKANIVLIMLLLNLFQSPELSNLSAITTPSEITPTITTIENAETIAFNKDLKLYIGNNLSASQVKALIGIIQVSNDTHPDKKITIESNPYLYSTNDDFLILINDISAVTTYTVNFEYSPSGFINKCILKPNEIVSSPTPSASASATPTNVASPTASPDVETTSMPSSIPSTTPTPTEAPTPTPIHGDVSTNVSF